MSKMNLLEIVQNILSSIDSDEVNSISDTVESTQVAEIVKETFYEMFGNLVIPEHKKFITLSSLADPSRPNYLKMEDDVQQIDWIRYQDNGYSVPKIPYSSNEFPSLIYLTTEDFVGILLAQGYTTTLPVSTVMLPLTMNSTTGPVFPVRTDKAPNYYTTFDDKYIVFDSFNKNVESSVQSSKTLAYGQVIPKWILSDTFIPWIDANLFPLLLAEAKATAFINLKQVSSSKEEQRSRRQRIRWQADTSKKHADPFDRLPDYGRRRR